MQDQSAYIADKVFPVVGVKKQSDLYMKYDKGNWFRDEAQLRAPGTESEGSGWTTFVTLTLLTSMPIPQRHPDELRDNADRGF